MSASLASVCAAICWLEAGKSCLREARDILGLVLTVAGAPAGLITFISEQIEYVDYLVDAAQSALLAVHMRKAFVKGNALLFSWDTLDDEFCSRLETAGLWPTRYSPQ